MSGGLSKIFSAAFGAFLGLSLLKFGNPVIMRNMQDWPANGMEWIIDGWPVVIGYWLLAGLALVGFLVARWRVSVPRWLILLPLVWFGWQCFAAASTVSPDLTAATLMHFLACILCFYLALFCLNQEPGMTWFWLGLLAGFSLVLANGFGQRFGGLAETRRHFWLYVYPSSPNVAPDLIKRMNSDRIFSTLIYPNALAGVLLLCLPPLLGFIWNLDRQFTSGARALLLLLVGGPALACLRWSGSKGGWLIMLLLGIIAAMHLRFPRRWKLVLAALLLVLGLAGFAVRYSAYFRKGATSVGARFDYWSAALRTAAANPFLGTGPGTFAIPYGQIKRPESEMARLAHNDYLEQASDSGFIGFAAFLGLVVAVLVRSKPKARPMDPARFSVWLGLLGWSLQSALEFNLYVPAIAWTSFAFMGWALSDSSKPILKSQSAKPATRMGS